MLLKMTSGSRPLWIEQLLIKVAIKHPQLHFLPYCRGSKEERESCSSDTASQHWAQESDGLENLPLVLSKQPRASVVLERASCWSHTQLTLPGHACSPSVQCWESGHICSSEPEASREPLEVDMASTAHHHCVHAHLCSCISFSLCCIPALEGKLLLYNLHGRRKKPCANDFCQDAGDIWNVNSSVASFASASVDTGSVFRVSYDF